MGAVAMKKLTTQEKKKLSYERDRRNVYGEAPHAARKNIPLQKAKRNRANRRAEHEALAIGGALESDTVADIIDTNLDRKAPSDWKKYPDAPLGEVIADKERRRKIMRENGGRSALRTITKLVKDVSDTE
ncbi:MAG: hypothetical protein IPM25_02370 [Chloracidobacterium sp.]|nr:hypothetical protein [Chloracidobacterium sp.]